jgi:nicotinamidase-related amidase
MAASRLLIINVQAGFINDRTRHVADRVQSLQDGFDDVVVSRFYNPEKALLRRLTGETGFALGSADTRLAFAPKAGATLTDTPRYSCVPGLLDGWRREAVARVYLCGIPTETAILASAFDVLEAGVEPIVLAHACGSHVSADLHDAALKILRRAIGERQVIGC